MRKYCFRMQFVIRFFYKYEVIHNSIVSIYGYYYYGDGMRKNDSSVDLESKRRTQLCNSSK